jgi:hypothetical protein
LTTVLAGLAVPALRATRNDAPDSPAGDKVWSTKKVMNRVHVGKESLMSLVYRDIHKAEPDWQTDEKNLAEIIRLMSMLNQQKPPRGSQEAWDQRVEDYLDKVRVARQKVSEHQIEPARASLDRLRPSCDDCHDNHGVK